MTNLEQQLEQSQKSEFSATKIIFVIALFGLSLVAFVSQTEMTSILFAKYHFNDPFLLMFLTHSSWFVLWPLQYTTVGLYKATKRYILHLKGTDFSYGKHWNGFRRAFASSVKTQHKNVAHTAELTAANNHPDYTGEFPSDGFNRYREFFTSRALMHLIISALLLSFILNLGGGTWFLAMKLSTGADVTAIYNCSAFTAYLFSIPILHETFSWTKMASVLIAISGVMVVAYGGGSNKDVSEYPHRLFGNFIISIGAVLYGLYEVLYKRKCCPPSGNVSARREATFSNFTMGLIGINSCLLVLVGLFIAWIFGFYRLQWPESHTARLLIAFSVLTNALFSVSFLGLMSLTSPVFSSVASFLTILLVGLVEWWFRGIAIGPSKAFGYALVMVGFVLLTYCSWSEITTEDTEDELIETDTESSYSNLPSTA